MVTEAIPEGELRETATSIEDRLVFGLIAVALPVPLAIAFGKGYGWISNTTRVGAAGVNLSYGIASILVVVGVYAFLAEGERDSVFKFRWPTRREFVTTVLCFPLGIAVFVGASIATAVAGLEMGGYEYTLDQTATVGAVVFGAIMVAPVAEEVLFRGLLLGSLLGRGISPLLAGDITILAFGLLHVALLGIAGVIATAAWAIFPTYLRLRYNNLTGAWLLHLINNIWGNIVVVALGFN